MKFLIYISSRIRHGQAIRHPDFKHSHEHGLYLYGGRELDADEFNAAAARVFAENYRTDGFRFAPKVVECKVDTAPIKVDIVPPTVADLAPVEEIKVDTAPETAADLAKQPTRRQRRFAETVPS